MHGLIDPFYEACEKAVEAGQIWCDQPVYLPARHGLKITRVNPEDDTELDYAVGGRTAEIFAHPPVHSLKMESNEGAVIAKTKRERPVIVLGGGSASEFQPRQGRARHAEIVMVVPVYGADQYDEHTRRRIRGYEFTNAFYLPESRELGFEEGFARLDHIQPVIENHLSKHRGLRLSQDALEALQEWLMTFLTGRQPADSLIDFYRRTVLTEGDELAAPVS
ncbi:MAG TPA: hypothetical protein VMU32_00715 [Solirubrobacteraceae bacterium]|nr:hypothetical protein [Solirubrobacteraceae bacterium]